VSEPVQPIVYFLDRGGAGTDSVGAVGRRAVVEPGV